MADNYVPHMPDRLRAASADAAGGAISRARDAARSPFAVAAAATLLAGAHLAVWFPGESGPDADSQYAQILSGRLDDWHPPIMAWLWSFFHLFANGGAPMFCFQVALYWLGFGLIGTALARAGRPLAAWAMLGVALLPPLLETSVILLKDVGMAVTFLTAVAALFWYRIEDRAVPRPVAAASLVLLVYGVLVRANAVFAVVPLLAYLIRPRWLARPWWLLALSLPVGLAMVPAANLINHRVLQAEPLHIIRSLQIFDITGIAYYSDDLAVLGPNTGLVRADVDRCYQPLNWDRLAPWGDCRFFWDRLAVSRDLRGVAELDARAAMGVKPNPDLLGRWVAAIVRHPLAYAQHRLASFASQVGLIDGMRGAGMMKPDLAPAADEAAAAPAPEPVYLALYDVAATPALWLAIGVGLLLWLTSARAPPVSPSRDAALALLLSGVPYALAFLVIGVASEFRYLFWSLIAILVALVILLSERGTALWTMFGGIGSAGPMPVVFSRTLWEEDADAVRPCCPVSPARHAGRPGPDD